VKQLTGADRRHLRSLANSRKVVVRVGDAGVTPGVAAAVDAALCDHELIKVRIAGDREQRHEFAERLAGDTHSALAGIVGHVAILYRETQDPEQRSIELPSSRPGAPTASG